MTKTEEQLQALIAEIKTAPPCEKHGRDQLEICMHCGETVKCRACHIIPCQCWNDE